MFSDDKMKAEYFSNADGGSESSLIDDGCMSSSCKHLVEV